MRAVARALAELYGPTDRLTVGVHVAARALQAILGLLLLPAQIAVALVDALLRLVTFRLWTLVIFLPLALIWLLLLALLLGTSWLWIRAWPLRPLLLLPGVVIAAVAHEYVLLAPDHDFEGPPAKFELTEAWPWSWYVVRSPVAPFSDR